MRPHHVPPQSHILPSLVVAPNEIMQHAPVLSLVWLILAFCSFKCLLQVPQDEILQELHALVRANEPEASRGSRHIVIQQQRPGGGMGKKKDSPKMTWAEAVINRLCKRWGVACANDVCVVLGELSFLAKAMAQGVTKNRKAAAKAAEMSGRMEGEEVGDGDEEQVGTFYSLELLICWVGSLTFKCWV